MTTNVFLFRKWTCVGGGEKAAKEKIVPQFSNFIHQSSQHFTNLKNRLGMQRGDDDDDVYVGWGRRGEM